MWLFEQHGFMSVVAYDPKKDRNKSSKFPEIAKQAGTHLLVRSRIKEDLDILKTVLPSLHVEEDPAADYAFRCVVPRTKFKEFLAKAVDDLQYDSHFKEAARDASPKVEGRYSAYMSIWGILAKLQPHTPWSGGSGYGGYGYGGDLWGDDFGGYYGGGYSSGRSKTGTGGADKSKGGKKSSGKGSSPAVVSGSTALYGKEGTDADERGYATVDDFKQAYLDGESIDFRLGEGPRKGFAKDDEVEGYFGKGVVIEVEGDRKDGIDRVRVRVKKGNTTTTSWFLSNYLVPASLPQIPEANEDAGDTNDPDLDTMDDLYTWLMEHERKPDHFPPEFIALLDPDAWEFLTRLQEHLGREETIVSVEDMDRIYDEVTWEGADTKTRLTLVADDKVPEKYKDEALRLPIFSEQ